MPWSFRKSVRLGKGMRLNFSKLGVGMSAGSKLFRVGTGPRGARVSTGVGPFRFTQSIGRSKLRSGSSSMGCGQAVVLCAAIWLAFTAIHALVTHIQIICLVIFPCAAICFLCFRSYRNNNPGVADFYQRAEIASLSTAVITFGVVLLGLVFGWRP